MQVVNSGARVQIPPSPFLDEISNGLKTVDKNRKCDIVVKLSRVRKISDKNKIKKLLTNDERCDNLSKLSQRQRTLITKQ